MTDLAVKQEGTTAMAEWHLMREQAKVLLHSNFCPPAYKTEEQVIMAGMMGKDLHLSLVQSLNTLSPIQNKLTASGQLMLALARRTGEVEDFKMETSLKGATVTIKRKGQTPYTTTFGPTEAMAMGLTSKDNYRKQAATMYQWRAVAANLRVTFPDAVLGLYTPEEMGANVTIDEEGNMQVIPEAQKRPEMALPEDMIEDIRDISEIEESPALPPQNPTQAKSQPPLATDKPTGHGKLITEPQRRLFMAQLDKFGWTHEQGRELMKEVTGKEHSKDLTNEELTTLLLELGERNVPVPTKEAAHE